jgi:hypothetical protein
MLRYAPFWHNILSLTSHFGQQKTNLDNEIRRIPAIASGSRAHNYFPRYTALMVLAAFILISSEKYRGSPKIVSDALVRRSCRVLLFCARFALQLTFHE